MAKITLYYPEEKKRILDKASEILKRDESSLSKFLIKKAEEHVRLHEPGNPQQVLENYGKPYIAPKTCHIQQCPNPAVKVMEFRGRLFACCEEHAKAHDRNSYEWRIREDLEVSR